jgi:hypothetical protein
MAAAVAALLFSPLHSRINDWAEHHFQPDLALLKRQMPEILASLSASASTRDLCTAVLPHFNTAIHATRSALLLDGRIAAACGVTMQAARRWVRDSMDQGTRFPERDHRDLLFPLRLALGGTSGRATAWLLLGPRPDGTFYGRDDLDAVRSTFPALQHGLASAIARDALHSEISRREKGVRTEINDLRQRLGMIEMSAPHFPGSGTQDGISPSEPA